MDIDRLIKILDKAEEANLQLVTRIREDRCTNDNSILGRILLTQMEDNQVTFKNDKLELQLPVTLI